MSTATLAALLVLSACSSPEVSLDRPTEIALSRDLAPDVERARSADGTAAPADSLLRLQRSLEVGIQRPASRDEARQRLFARWAGEPTNFLWIDLAYRYRYLLGHGDVYRSRTSSGALADTSSAASQFLLGCREEYVGGGGPYFQRVREFELDPLRRVLVELKLAAAEASTGEPIASVRRVQAALPLAREVGGARLSAQAWAHIATGLLLADRLDDALHAVDVARDLASKAADPYGEVMARQLRGRILADRREYDAAFEEWDSCVDEAERADFPWPLSTTLDLAAGLALSTNDPARALQYDTRVLGLRQASDDSLNVPRVMTNVAYDYRLLAQPDSSLAVLQRARRWVDAYADEANLAMMPLFEAEHWCYVGEYARAESLLAAAAGEVPGQSFPHEEAKFLVAQAHTGIESGMPDLAYRSLDRLRELQGRFVDAGPEQNLRADLEILSATLLTQQGEFRRAQAALDRARAAIGQEGEDAKRWEAHRVAGELARLRGDRVRARDEYQRAWELARAGGDPDRVAESRFRYADALFQLSELSAVNELLESLGGDASYGGRFRTQLHSRLLLGMIRTREGHWPQALAQLDAALAQTTPRSPRDLVALLQIERCRALRGAGEAEQAQRAARDALAQLDALGAGRPTPEVRAMSQRPRREATELLLGLMVEHHEASAELAAATLALIREEPAPAPSLTFFVGEERCFQWTRTGEGLSLAFLPGRDSLRDGVDPVVFDLASPARTVDTAAAARLRDALLLPLRDHLATDATLRIDAEDVLAAVPWAALPWFDESPLLERVAVVDGSGATERASRRSESRMLAVGANGSASEDPGTATLRSAEAEAERVAAQWPAGRATLRVGPDARWAELQQEDLGGFDVIHIASHAVVHQGQPQRSTLRLAAEDRAEPLTLAAARRLPLRAELIYLSCCEAALPAGGGSLEDFAGAFLDAGAGAVVASRMRVDDEASAYLAEAFYRHWLAGSSAAQSLRAAQRETRTARPEWAHPFYWASYRVLTR